MCYTGPAPAATTKAMKGQSDRKILISVTSTWVWGFFTPWLSKAWRKCALVVRLQVGLQMAFGLIDFRLSFASVMLCSAFLVGSSVEQPAVQRSRVTLDGIWLLAVSLRLLVCPGPSVHYQDPIVRFYDLVSGRSWPPGKSCV